AHRPRPDPPGDRRGRSRPRASPPRPGDRRGGRRPGRRGPRPPSARAELKRTASAFAAGGEANGAQGPGLTPPAGRAPGPGGMRKPTLALLALLAGCGTAPPPELPPPPPPAAPAPAPAPAPPVAAVPTASASAAPAADDKFAGVTIKVEKVAGTVYALIGAG